MFSFLLVTWWAASAVSAGEPSVAALEQQVVFRHEGSDWYRIPSIAVTPAGTVLVFTGRRKGSPSDFGHDTDMVLRRSEDGGRSFLPPQTIASKPGVDIHSGPVVFVQSAGRILKFCRYWPATNGPQQFVYATPYEEMVRLGYVDHVVASDDEGRTWSDPRPLPLPYPADAVSCGTGNGNHGIQLTNGRLLIQGGFVPRSGARSGQRQMCVFASDDGGTNWLRGATISHSAIREFVLAQLSDGSIYYNFRNQEKGVGRRQVSGSDDGGLTFGALQIDPGLPEPQCHAGLVYVPPSAGSGAGTLLFSNPARSNTGGGYNAQVRRDLTVRASFDGGRTWPRQRALNDQFAAYSDLAAGPDGTIHCVYESGSTAYHDQLTYARFPLSWLTDPGQPPNND